MAQTLETLAQLGLTSINLYSNNSAATLPDGSQILGTTTYTKAADPFIAIEWPRGAIRVRPRISLCELSTGRGSGLPVA